MEQATYLTTLEAISALAPLVGAGGISGIIIAYFSYRKAVRDGRRGEPEKAGLGISALLADSTSVENTAKAISDLSTELKQIRPVVEKGQGDFTRLMNDLIDEIRRVRRAIEDFGELQNRD